MSGVSKVTFFHYLSVIVWPPLSQLYCGKPVTFAWQTFLLAICLIVLGLAFPPALFLVALCWLVPVRRAYYQLNLFKRGVELS